MKHNNFYDLNFTKENYSSMVFHLYSRHEEAASNYRQIVSDLKEDSTLKKWFESLANYRQEMAKDLRVMVEDNGSVPLKPSQEMKSYFHDRSDDIIEYINSDNEVGLIELSLEAEESIGKYYQKVETDKDVPLGVREKLEEQHDRILNVIQKARRLHRVPEHDREDFAV